MSSSMVIKAAQQSIYRGKESLFKTLPIAIRTIIEERLWAEQLDKNGVQFKSFEEFCNARSWHGLELKTRDLLDYLKGSPDVLRLVKAELSRGTKPFKGVLIDSGAPHETDRPDYLPREKWRMLMWVKRDFLKRSITYYCRNLFEFIQDAESMYQALGFKEPSDMLEEGFEMDPCEIELAFIWLALRDPEEAKKFLEVADAYSPVFPSKREEIFKILGAKNPLEDIYMEEVSLD